MKVGNIPTLNSGFGEMLRLGIPMFTRGMAGWWGQGP